MYRIIGQTPISKYRAELDIPSFSTVCLVTFQPPPSVRNITQPACHKHHLLHAHIKHQTS
jgi:hypothetical protein